MTAHTFILWTGQCSVDSNDLTKLTASQGGLADHTHSGASTYLITVSLTVEEHNFRQNALKVLGYLYANVHEWGWALQ